MLDLKLLEKETEAVEAKLRSRGEIAGLAEVVVLVKKRKQLILETQRDQEKRNQASAAMKGASKAEIDKNRASLKELSTRVKHNEKELKLLEEGLKNQLLSIPNIPLSSVPFGKDETDNVETSRVLTPRVFNFEIKDHVSLTENSEGIDLLRGAKVSGSRFAFLKGEVSELNRALANFMLDFHRKAGDTEISPPFMVREQAMFDTGQLPKFRDEAFEVPVKGKDPYFLIPTSEVSVTNYYANEILEEAELPIHFCAYSPCFRSEAGAAGRDTKGMIRQHQFEKVEMIRFCKEEDATGELEAMTQRASGILESLELPHRIMALCTGDMGFSSEMTNDIEVWLPSEKRYREISSCSSCGTFQARRAQIRFREQSSGKARKPKLLATLNGSGLAVGRTLIALLENHQNQDGSVTIPEKLRPFMNGKKAILCE